jgi:hypothetical protein
LQPEETFKKMEMSAAAEQRRLDLIFEAKSYGQGITSWAATAQKKPLFS